MTKKQSFKSVIGSIPELTGGFKEGLQAVKGSDRKLITAADSSFIDGSVDIDKCTVSSYPNDNRWDYAIGYNSKVYFVEVHPAYSSEMEVIRKKKEWLEKWISNNALNNYPYGTPKLQWVATNGVHIIKTGSYLRKLSQMGIKLKSHAKIG